MTHLRDVFGRLGFSDKDIVALSGAHNLVWSSSFENQILVSFGGGWSLINIVISGFDDSKLSTL